jgi:hypothetical protein
LRGLRLIKKKEEDEAMRRYHKLYREQEVMSTPAPANSSASAAVERT